jgi:hypothetical protein
MGNGGAECLDLRVRLPVSTVDRRRATSAVYGAAYLPCAWMARSAIAGGSSILGESLWGDDRSGRHPTATDFHEKAERRQLGSQFRILRISVSPPLYTGLAEARLEERGQRFAPSATNEDSVGGAHWSGSDRDVALATPLGAGGDCAARPDASRTSCTDWSTPEWSDRPVVTARSGR